MPTVYRITIRMLYYFSLIMSLAAIVTAVYKNNIALVVLPLFAVVVLVVMAIEGVLDFDNK